MSDLSPNVNSEPTEALLLTIEDAALLLSISKSRVFDLCRDGKLRSVKLGKRRMVPRQCLTDYVDELIETAS